MNETVHLKRIVGSFEVNLTESINDLWAGNIPEVSFWTVTKYPFDKDQEAEVSGGPDYLLPRISGEHEPWTTVDFVYRGFVLPDRSGNFDIRPWIQIRGERSLIIADRVDSTWEGTDVIEFEGTE